jgi:glutathione synthase/RimK-type ligase-like ATP-grasp enzyme
MLSGVRNAKNAAVAQTRAAVVDEMLLTWADITPALVLNRPRHMAVNSSKPYQSQLIRRCGFLVPETLISTIPSAALQFQKRHGEVIYKSVSGVRSQVVRLAPTHFERLHDIANCPTQFQEFIPGRDLRAHVIGCEVFASELICDADDYRYPGDETLEIRECRLPHAIEERCIALAQSMELPVAGIDLRRTPEDEWYCFEVNPSPAFTFYQEFTGQPIAEAIATLLIGGVRPATSQHVVPFDSTLPITDESPLLVPASLWME